MIKAEDFKWLDQVYHSFHLGSYLCLSGALTDCFLPLHRFHSLPISMIVTAISDKSDRGFSFIRGGGIN